GLPGAAVEAALDVDQPALGQELAGELRVLSPDHDVVELGGVAFVGGDPQGADRQARGGEAELRRRGEAADELDPVEGGTGVPALLRGCRWRGGLRRGRWLAGHRGDLRWGGSTPRCRAG